MAVAVWLLASLVSACGGSGPASITSETPSASPAPTVRLTFTTTDGEDVELLVEIADAPDERARGLMLRESMPEDHGMLFVFEAETKAGFWMKDTLIPLSIAFISATGIVVDILDMEPLSEQLRYSAQPYAYAVEANRGWFQRNRIEAGDRAGVP